jgi:xanthine dehydrogenase YagS FAD-binding subunit
VYWLNEHGERAALIAGGTDLLGLIKDGISGPKMPVPEVLVNVKTIPTLGRIDAVAGGGLRVGATVTLADLETHPLVQERYPALAQAARSVATTQIRAMGTVGGNLCQRPWCWYFRHRQFECFKRGGRQCFALPGNNRTYFAVLGLGICVMAHPSDLAPALIALGARAEIAGPGGPRAVPIEEFFRGPRSVSETVLGRAEILTGVELPPRPPGARSAFLKHRVRNTWDFALAEVAVSLTPRAGRCEDARVALGGIAPYPFRAVAAEAALRGETLGEAVFARAADAVLAKARPLPMNGYKVDLTRALVRRALSAASARESGALEGELSIAE